MFCPGCGAQSTEQQKFCRSCGFNLEKIAQAVAEQRMSTSTSSPMVESDAPLKDQLRHIERWLTISATILATLLVDNISWAIISKIMIEKDQFWQGLTFLLIIASAAVSLFFVARREELQEKLADKSARATPLPPAETTNKLLPKPQPEPVSSVAEQTTRQLAGHQAEKAISEAEGRQLLFQPKLSDE